MCDLRAEAHNVRVSERVGFLSALVRDRDEPREQLPLRERVLPFEVRLHVVAEPLVHLVVGVDLRILLRGREHRRGGL